MPNPIAGFPDETTSGVPDGTKLSEYTGPMKITQDGTVIDGKTISGGLVIEADNVVIKNSVIDYNSAWGINAEHAGNITIENNRIVGPGSSADSNSAILGSGKFIGNDISASENGITLTNGSSTVTGNYIHDLQDGGSGPHYDGISVQGGQDGVLIQGNTIVGRDTSNIFIKDDFGPINDVTVDHNLLLGDPGYDVYVDGRGNGGAITNVSITDNYVQEGFYGTYLVQQSSPTISGNVEFAKGHAPSGAAPSEPTTSQPDPTPSKPAEPGNSNEGSNGSDGSAEESSGSGGSSGDQGGQGGQGLIHTGAGKDVLTGSAGDDVFVFDKVSNMGTGYGSDMITNFQHGHDRIDLSSIDANGSAKGDASFHFLSKENAVFDKAPGALAYHFEDRAGSNHDTTVIQGDVNGDGMHDFEINLQGLIHLTGDDFTL